MVSEKHWSRLKHISNLFYSNFIHTGESFQSSISTDFTLESYSNDIVEIITSLNASNPYESDRKQPILCGQSWGASIVLNVGLNFPHLVNGIVCVDGGYIDLQV